MRLAAACCPERLAGVVQARAQRAPARHQRGESCVHHTDAIPECRVASIADVVEGLMIGIVAVSQLLDHASGLLFPVGEHQIAVTGGGAHVPLARIDLDDPLQETSRGSISVW